MSLIEYGADSIEVEKYLSHFNNKKIPEGAGENIGNKNYKIFGFTIENIGIVSLCILLVIEKTALITGISTSPQHLRKGYATKMISELEYLQLDDYILGAYAINANSMDCFIKCGFTDIRKDIMELSKHFFIFNDYVNVVKYINYNKNT